MPSCHDRLEGVEAAVVEGTEVHQVVVGQLRWLMTLNEFQCVPGLPTGSLPQLTWANGREPWGNWQTGRLEIHETSFCGSTAAERRQSAGPGS